MVYMYIEMRRILRRGKDSRPAGGQAGCYTRHAVNEAKSATDASAKAAHLESFGMRLI